MNTIARYQHQPWNKGKLVGQKAPLRVRDIWAIRVRLQLAEKTRDLALFNLAIDSKLSTCDFTKLRVRDIETDSPCCGAAPKWHAGCYRRSGVAACRGGGL